MRQRERTAFASTVGYAGGTPVRLTVTAPDGDIVLDSALKL